ncbi:D-alanyl-D-alanine carboxypeptidase/D-alanyl-D-alanine-endopeptidase [Cereibacter sphaeroides WS8N]|uniref:D-alanyl-D-alanine carboxypeptidase/D-alanyl-D-alanine endopeptidase n=1 Tax=Cereibacter sphaeroides TaxID=1063 RepID=UPI00020DF9E7|nr:D-alanyl-D-alanine carboxypeptidase/D-alanyl-D-alanine-endopeptidase [Cereibacter sphaeroides]EGJ22056.1 D-alanyl-D-alanine carboxypeptidase/D-alanyl-D-alanine-endopeptidase [Cereibacter sphaeroides WS8N]
MTFTRRWLLSALLASAATPVLAEAPLTSPRPPRRGFLEPPPEAGDLVARAALGGAVAYVVADARSGTVLEAANAALRLPPASTAKTVTALYGLETLGPDFRFTTRLLATGPITNGILQGDLILSGSGDPTLSTDALGEMAARLRARGITGITGRYMADASALPAVPLIDPEQPDHVGYNPALSGLNLNFNRVHFEWKQAAKGWSVTMDARAERFVPPVSMARMKVVTRDLPIYTYAGDQGSDSWTVASGALGAAGSRWLPVRHPEAYTAEVFQTLARAQGIDLPAAQVVRVRPEGAALVEWQSDPLREILRDMLKFSTNITAEAVGLAASGAPSLAQSAAAMSAWANRRFGLSTAFDDHSGLGGGSLVSAADMVTALLAAEREGLGLRPLLKRTEIGGGKGTKKGARRIAVAAKTGTLNFVSGLVGIATAEDGRDLVFAIYCADRDRRSALPMEARERPPGGSAWLGRARGLQRALIERWAALPA